MKKYIAIFIILSCEKSALGMAVSDMLSSREYKIPSFFVTRKDSKTYHIVDDAKGENVQIQYASFKATYMYIKKHHKWIKSRPDLSSSFRYFKVWPHVTYEVGSETHEKNMKLQLLLDNKIARKNCPGLITNAARDLIISKINEINVEVKKVVDTASKK
ncbi:MAG: hypothetical protein WC707_05335 [Candidatus Babeliaceae bacterium]|jgi:hypothetical protein